METASANIPRLAYTIEEAAAASGLSNDTLYRLIGSGDLQSVKVRARRLIPVIALQRLCGADTHQSAA